MSQNLSSAAVVIGALRVKMYQHFQTFVSFSDSLIYVVLFGLRFYVNSYGHVKRVSSPNHTFPEQA